MENAENVVAITDPLESLLHVLIGREHAIESLVNILDIADKKGLLTMVEYLLHDGSDLVDAGIEWLAQPSTIALKEQGTEWVSIAKKIDPAMIARIVDLMSVVTQKIEVPEQTVQIHGLWDIVKIMRDPDISVALSKIFGILKALGAVQRER